ncbi:Ser/Thr protein kinase [Limnospira indica PCC 8005]|uniref:non-specific serine/threonine protein kinase n=2 Tax=Sirenicapillariaceae TaxID=2934961 RepID=A0A9P1NYT6_9CYAN|nr:Ser/Thr protein kinase [Limnospira indica PCC 8005]
MQSVRFLVQLYPVPTMLNPLDSPPNPTVILNNRYEILLAIASGGFGETFLAEDNQMPSRRRCAIKRLKPKADDPNVHHIITERFRREATVLEKLGEISDRIPSLYAYLEEDGQFYLVQEWIEGEILTSRIQQQGSMSETQVRDLLLNLLPVLHTIHSHGLIHRDIKPDNIILQPPHYKPVLIDFGAVKEIMGTVLNSRGNPTPSMVIGTPGFMASEQATGHPFFASDLFSLGVTAIYMLTGKTPQELAIDENTAQIQWRHLVPTVNPEFADILDRATRFHPSDRFSDAQEMLTALEGLSHPIASTEISVPPSTVIFPKATSPKPPQRRPDWQIPAIVGVILGILAGLGLTIFWHSQSEPKESEAIAETYQLPLSFYFIGDSAFYSPHQAENKRHSLLEDGYTQADFFWSANYSNLSSHNSYQVYSKWFETQDDCEAALKEYHQYNPNSYCGFATKL